MFRTASPHHRMLRGALLAAIALLARRLPGKPTAAAAMRGSEALGEAIHLTASS